MRRFFRRSHVPSRLRLLHSARLLAIAIAIAAVALVPWVAPRAAGISAQIVVPGPTPGPGPIQPFPNQPRANQFGAFEAPPYKYDQVRGELVNLETQQVKPIAITADSRIIAVANDADGRVVFLGPDLAFLGETRVGQGICSIIERPGIGSDVGEFWVTMSHQTATIVISRTTFRITDVIRPAIPNGQVGAGHASTPMGIDFNQEVFTDADGTFVPIGARAYIAAKHTNSLIVVDANLKSVLEVIELTAMHNASIAHLNEPRSVTYFQGSIYVSSHLSGNQTTPSQSVNPGSPGLPLGFDNVDIIDLNNDPNRSLPDYDVAELELSTGQITMISGLYTVGFGMMGHQHSGRIAVGSFRSRNGEFTGEGAFPAGSVVQNGVGIFRVNNPAQTTGFFVAEDLGPQAEDLVLPIDLTDDALGRIYVAAYGNSRVGVVQPTGAYFGSIDTDDGPAGVAIARGGKRLYVYCRIEGTVQVFDIASIVSPPSAPLASFDLFDPTFVNVKEGRRIFNTPNSGNGATNCASCHPEARKDGLGWQLSKFFDVAPGPATEFKDLKGVMVTQDLRNLWGTAPYHWRGEQPDIESFNGAFVNLLKGSLLSPGDMDLMKSYIFSCYYPPNPLQQMSRVFSAEGKDGFLQFITDPVRCNVCHLLPTGTDCSITEAILGSTSPRSVESAQLIGAWSKESDIINTDNISLPTDEFPLAPMTGFGMQHEGVLNDISQFNRFFFAAKTDLPALTQFVHELDSGLSPFSSFCRMWTQANATAVGRIVNYMIPQATAMNGDLVATGRIRPSGVWIDVGLLYDPSITAFRADTTSLGTFTFAALKTLVQNGDAELFLYGVPYWSGERIALDRDRDGVRDGDELTQGLDPQNPDTDGDGLWDGYDPQPLNPSIGVLSVNAPIVIPSSFEVVFENTSNIKFAYSTNQLSPSRIEFGETPALGTFSGDPLLPTFAANDSNLWKTKHMAFIRPQLSQGVEELNDGTMYHFAIWTQGQNGVTLVTPGTMLVAALPQTVTDIQTPNRRVGSIVLTSTDNGNGTFTYDATVQLVMNNGSPTGTPCLAGRFAIYDSNGFFTTTASSAQTAANGIATFSITTSVGEQVTGDRVCFDLPMVIDTINCNGTLATLTFPGQWSPGPSSLETTAP